MDTEEDRLLFLLLPLLWVADDLRSQGRARGNAARPRFIKPKTEPGLAPVKTEPGLAPVKMKPGLLAPVKAEHGEVELNDDAALEWARQDSLKMARERQCAALRRFTQCR